MRIALPSLPPLLDYLSAMLSPSFTCSSAFVAPSGSLSSGAANQHFPGLHFHGHSQRFHGIVLVQLPLPLSRCPALALPLSIAQRFGTSKHDIERLVHAHGGNVTQNPTSDTSHIIAGSMNIKVRGIAWSGNTIPIDPPSPLCRPSLLLSLRSPI